ncbi:MAG: VOC family protein [Proteobacteria bacterium]|nr:VOC family protein [Pseudomonadota bacterium]
MDTESRTDDKKFPAVKVKNFSHIGIHVSDMDRSLEFYRQLIGFSPFLDIEFEDPGLDSVLSERNSRARIVKGMIGELTLELIQTLHKPRPTRDMQTVHVGELSVTIHTDDLESAFNGCQAIGAEIVCPIVEIGGTRVFIVADPDGNKIEFGDVETQ